MKRNPDFNPWFSAIPKDKKKNVDIAGLVAFTKKSNFILGIILIVVPYIVKLIQIKDTYIPFMIFFISFGGTMMIYIKSMEFYNYNAKKNKTYIYIVFGIIAIFALVIIGAIYYISL
jgi:uncharacterized membrane protein